ncbi:MAG: Mu transposase C-terminal domain-containing protein [Lachnospiraceae bacterium]|nr:Mu transposase C-terminal domain-containing protein [Lachnospiraceae bacterium]
MQKNNYRKNKLLKTEDSDNKIRIIRILGTDTDNNRVFVIDCIKQTMPIWLNAILFADYSDCEESELLQITGMTVYDMDSDALDAKSKRFIHEHYTMISGILPFVADKEKRNYVISQIADENNVTKQTIRYYLCLYLTYQDISVFAPRQKQERELTEDEKNIRWAINKYYLTQNENTLTTAYNLMLKEKYTDANGVLLSDYPSIYQFRYFEKKHRKLQTVYISRKGKSHYARNNRPLLGTVQDYAPCVGVGLLDATVLDIYLINESGNLTGRPILTLCIDCNTSMIMGYMLSWEGGVYSLRGLFLNVIADKIEHCKQFGICINRSQWDSELMPSKLVSDRGSEYISYNFEQIAELGIVIENLPAYRAELKGVIEKAFSLLQDLFKPQLKGKGVIEPDFQERGSHDYRKDACLTMKQFETILLHCIVYYNSKRIVENYPYTPEMLQANISPYASDIFNYGKNQTGANLITVSADDLILCLLPRTEGKFTRQGLKVNNLRYRNVNYTEKYLSGGTVTVAYNPDDVSNVWLLENGCYIRFEVIFAQYSGLNLSDVEIINQAKKNLIRAEIKANTQAKIDLVDSIQSIANNAIGKGNVKVKGIRDTRQTERKKNHINYAEGLSNDQ